MSGRFARDVLLKEKWSGSDLGRLTVKYISRGSPGDISSLEGESIDDLGRSFFITCDGTMIPYHRVLSILRDNEIIWRRPSTDGEVHDEE